MTKRFGLAANALGVACIAIALVKQHGDPVIIGALDRAPGVLEANIVPWLVAAALLVVVGTGSLLLKR